MTTEKHSGSDYDFNGGRVLGTKTWTTKPLASDLANGETVGVRSSTFTGLCTRVNGMIFYFDADASSTTSTSSTTTSTTSSTSSTTSTTSSTTSSTSTTTSSTSTTTSSTTSTSSSTTS